MLHRIYAPSGYGKTEEILRRIGQDVKNGTHCYLIVPEQQAYISERDLLLRLPPNAGLYLKIVNFSGLAEDVLRRYGGIAERKAGNGARSVLMWKTLQELSPILKQYKSAGSDTGLTGKMLALSEELRASNILPEQLEDAVKTLPADTPLAKKLSDIAVIDATFREKIESLFGSVGTNDRLLKVAGLLSEKEHDYFSNCNIYVDSFTGFTHPEYMFLECLMKQANHVTVALCSDGPCSEKPHLFSLKETSDNLLEHAKRACCDCKDEIPSSSFARKRSDALNGIEAHLWNFAIKPDEQKALQALNSSGIHPLVCSNSYDEAEACALNIEGLIQSGISYGEIAVVMRDAETYRGILDAALERHGIPYFFSERTDLASTPLSRLILSALRVIGRGYRTQDVMSLLKTGLTGVSVRDAALFEEYCATWHITGKRFLDSAWSMNPDGLTDRKSKRGKEILDAANRAREILIAPLLRLQANFNESKLLPKRCRAIYAYLCDLSISEKLSKRAKDELSLGQIREAGDTVRLYQFVLDALTELSTLLPDTEVNTDELLSLLTLFFAGTDLGSVPGTHDCVMVGSADLLRVEDIKASFLLGLSEGEFPRALSDDSLLTESDKSELKKLKISFNRRANTLYSDELFYVYRAMTKPSEHLFLSYPCMHTDGSLRSPSLAFNRVRILFNLPKQTFDLSQIQQNSPKSTEKFDSTQRKAAPLSERELSLSSSSIQTFALCPYRYYASHPLGLRAQKDSEIHASDEGTFLHYIFENFLKSALNEDGTVSLPEKDQIPEKVDEIIETYLSQVCPIPMAEMDARLLHLFDRLRGLGLVMLNGIVEEIASGDFVPSHFELKINGKREKDLPSVKIPLKNGSVVRLNGTVDRVDFHKQDGKVFIRIVDYKTGKHEFNAEDVASGQDIQLVLYLYAVLSSAPNLYVPAGAQFLYSKNDKDVPSVGRSGFLLDDNGVLDAADKEGRYKKTVKRISTDKINSLFSDMTNAVTEIGERILSGEANKTPSEDACRYCDMLDICDVACRPKF